MYTHKNNYIKNIEDVSLLYIYMYISDVNDAELSRDFRKKTNPGRTDIIAKRARSELRLYYKT